MPGLVNGVGWVDVEAHIRFQGSETLQQNIHHLLGIKELKRMELYHVSLTEVDSSVEDVFGR